MLEEFIVKSNQAETQSEVFDLFEHHLEEYGYNRVVYSLLTDHVSLGLEAQHGIFSTYPKDWLDYYQEHDYHLSDPVFRNGYIASKPFLWDDFSRNTKLSAKAKLVMNEAKEAKLYNGIGIPINGPLFETAGFGIASTDKNIKPDTNTTCLVNALCMQCHNVITTQLATKEKEKHIQLTQREQEILLWAAEGKSDSIIADILGITHPTVRFHFNNIFRKLQANERTLAVVKAIRLGLIVPQTVKAPYQG